MGDRCAIFTISFAGGEARFVVSYQNSVILGLGVGGARPRPHGRGSAGAVTVGRQPLELMELDCKEIW